MSAPALLDFLPWMRYPLQGLWEGSTTSPGSSILGGFSAQAVLVPFVTFWLVLEVAFFVLILYLHRKLNERTLPPPSPLTPQQIILKVLEILDQIKDEYPFERFITLWCGAHDISDVKEGNFRTWLAWALLGKHLEELSPQEFRMIADSTEMIEVRYQHRLERGFNPDIEPIRMTLEPLKIIHRPLALYMAIAFVPRMLGELYLAMLGFTKLRLHETNYWYRPATSPGAKLPLVFFHGVGPGVCAYGGLVSRLADDRSAVLVEIPHIAMGLEEFRAKSAEEVVSLVRAICVRHEILHFCVAGHSYGSILAGWVIRGMREEVKQAVLLDPVCFLLCLPTTPLNFLYNDRVQAHTLPWSPSKGRNQYLNLPVRTHKLHVLDLVLHFFVSRELTIANAMRRQFWWHTKILYPEDLHCPTVVGLASEDVLLSAHAIRKHLEEPTSTGQVKLLWWEGSAHGEMLTDLPAMEELDMTIRLQEKERYYGRGGGPPVWEGTGRRRRSRAATGGGNNRYGSKLWSVEGGAAPRALGGGSGSGGRAPPQRASFRHPAPIDHHQATLLPTPRMPADSDNGHHHHQQQQAGEHAADDDKAQAEPNSSSSSSSSSSSKTAAAAAAHDKPQQQQEEEEGAASMSNKKRTAEDEEGARRKTMMAAMATREAAAETVGEPRLLVLEESSASASSSASSRP